MTLAELFWADKLTLENIEDRVEGEETPYWHAVLKFCRQKWDDDLGDFSEKQYSWAHRIVKDMIDYRIKKKGRI